MNRLKKQKVLFLCTANSARSQMAEALLKEKVRQKAEGQLSVFSAGTHPETVDARAIAAIKTFGITAPDTFVSKHLDSFEGEEFDYVITLCDQANNECRSLPNAKQQLAWDFPDPKTRSGHQPFLQTLKELDDRLTLFLSVEGLLGDSDAAANDSFQMDPIAFYKSLTDTIRLKTLMLTHYHGELCVCELMEALEEDSQPKVSRNLAVLKKSRILSDRKYGKWVFYRINTELPLWAKSVIAQTTENNMTLIINERQRLVEMQDRPDKDDLCK